MNIDYTYFIKYSKFGVTNNLSRRYKIILIEL